MSTRADQDRAEHASFRAHHPDRGGDPEVFAGGLAEHRARLGGGARPRDRYDAPVSWSTGPVGCALSCDPSAPGGRGGSNGPARDERRGTGRRPLLRPEKVVEVTCEHTEGAVPSRSRHTAQFVRWRPDRDPESCRYDQLDEPVRYDLDSVLHGGVSLRRGG